MKSGIGKGLRTVEDNSERKALFGFKETQPAANASKLLEATETKQTMSATLDPITLYMNKWGQGAPSTSLSLLPDFPPIT